MAKAKLTGKPLHKFLDSHISILSLVKEHKGHFMSRVVVLNILQQQILGTLPSQKNGRPCIKAPMRTQISNLQRFSYVYGIAIFFFGAPLADKE